MAFRSIDEQSYQAEILPLINPALAPIFNQAYALDIATNKRYLQVADQPTADVLVNEIKRINYDTRWITFARKNLSKPFLILQFRDNQFYNSPTSTTHFGPTRYFHESSLNRHTFLVEVQLLSAHYSEDVAIYKIINTPQEIIDVIPSINVDFAILDTDAKNLSCLQSAPSNHLGRLLNDAAIEGHLDHFDTISDRFEGNYVMDGLRYLIRGYFLVWFFRSTLCNI